MNVLDQMSEGGKHTLDAAAAIVAVGTIAQWLPPIAALFSIIWLAIQIMDRIKHGPRKHRD
jgi:hypothetical protein